MRIRTTDSGTEVVCPILHLNGTGADGLIGPLERAADSIADALEALYEAAPNERDYYTSPGSFQRAVSEHTVCAAKLREVLVRLMTIREDIKDQRDERSKR